MLFIALCRGTSGTPIERAIRRAQWQYPDGVKLIAEYWLQMPDPSVIVILEADSLAPIMAVNTEWSDVFNITITPALTAAEGLALTQQMMQE